MNLSETRKGELAIIVQAGLNGLFPILTILSYRSLGPLVSLITSLLFATVLLGLWILAKNKWAELSDKSIWKDLFFIVFFIGILYYSLFYFGLRYTNAGNASLIALTEIFFSYLFFNIWKKENISAKHICGALLMMLGALTVLFPKTGHPNNGDLLIMLGVMFAPFGNFYQQRLRKKIGGETLLFLRYLLTLPFILLLIFAFREQIQWPDIYKSLWFLLLNGILVFAISKLLWLEGIHRISVTKAAALLSLSPLLTLVFAYIILNQIPQPGQLIAFIPLFFGLILITSNKQ